MSGRGISGLVRLKDEEVWCRLALDSFIDWCDELVIVLNKCSDRTPEIVEAFREEHGPRVRVFDYPFDIWPMGPGHDQISVDDPRSSAAFYNFTQKQAIYSHAVKLDGDMVMMDWAGAEIRKLFESGRDRIRFEGRDIVGDDLTHIGCHPLCRTNGVYKLGSGVGYHQGPLTQNLRGVPDVDDAFGHKPAFLHFKWARKSFESATVQWPADWETMPHFQRIAERRHPVAKYEGEYPSAVAALL